MKNAVASVAAVRYNSLSRLPHRLRETNCLQANRFCIELAALWKSVVPDPLRSGR